jgi:hypothetical protein
MDKQPLQHFLVAVVEHINSQMAQHFHFALLRYQ